MAIEATFKINSGVFLKRQRQFFHSLHRKLTCISFNKHYLRLKKHTITDGSGCEEKPMRHVASEEEGEGGLHLLFMQETFCLKLDIENLILKEFIHLRITEKINNFDIKTEV